MITSEYLRLTKTHLEFFIKSEVVKTVHTCYSFQLITIKREELKCKRKNEGQYLGILCPSTPSCYIISPTAYQVTKREQQRKFSFVAPPEKKAGSGRRDVFHNKIIHQQRYFIYLICCCFKNMRSPFGMNLLTDTLFLLATLNISFLHWAVDLYSGVR